MTLTFSREHTDDPYYLFQARKILVYSSNFLSDLLYKGERFILMALAIDLILAMQRPLQAPQRRYKYYTICVMFCSIMSATLVFWLPGSRESRIVLDDVVGVVTLLLMLFSLLYGLRRLCK